MNPIESIHHGISVYCFCHMNAELLPIVFNVFTSFKLAKPAIFVIYGLAGNG